MIFICFSSPGDTDSHWFTRVWKTDDGLINNNILATVQSPDNYLWVVPSVGLMRFDGVRFSRFPLEHFTGPMDNHICRVLCGRTGVLWIATYGGRVIGLKPDFSVVTVPQALHPACPPVAMAEDGSGGLWLANSVAIYRVKDGRVERFGAKKGVPSGDLHALISDGDGRTWLAKGNQICFFRGGQFHRAANLRGVRALAATPTNAVWVVANGHLWSSDTGGARDCGTFPGLSRAERGAFLEDRTGAVWIGTAGDGLIRYGKSGFEKIETSYPSILSLTEDREGNLWVGTDGGGLDRVSLSSVRREFVDNTPLHSQILSICQDARGGLWGATHDGLLVSRSNGRWTPVFTNAPFSGTVRCVAADRSGGIWLGTRGGNLLRLANRHYTTQAQHAIRGPISTLFPATSGDLWILGLHTLKRLHNSRLQDVPLPRSVEKFTAITEDAAGHIWVGAKGVVIRSEGDHFVDETPRLPIAHRTICCLYGARDGSLWISSGGVGLLRFKNGHVGRVGLRQGLFNNYISQMVADGRGWLWFASDHGIFKIRQRELERAMQDPQVRLHPIVYGRNEGLQGLEALFSTADPFVFPRALRTCDGRVWLLTHTGVVVADPKLLPGNSAPPVLLTRVVMDGQSIAAYGGVFSQTVADLKTLNAPLRLPPGHRHLEFDYTAFHFSAPGNIHFRYQLAGFDNGWIDAETERHADYSRLTAGSYQFCVEASVGDGPWNKKPATLTFTVAPFFWQTWWFRLGALLLFTSCLFAIIRYVSFRRIQAKMRLLEQRAALDRERTRIARDLHDDLGCSLNKVALTMEMMQRDSAPSHAGKIQHCWTMVREIAGSVDEIVWAINPRNDTLHYMVDYISQFAVEFLQAAEISCLMDLPDSIPERTISPEARHNMLLVVKEALNNIVRHAKASDVRVRITTSDNQVAIIIQDNGRGFDRAPDTAYCDGLRNMRQRMEEIDGRFELDSQLGAGTCVKFLYFWQGNPEP